MTAGRRLSARRRTVCACVGVTAHLLLCSSAHLFAQTSLTIYNDGRVLVRRSLATAVSEGMSRHRVELDDLDPGSLIALDSGVSIVGVTYDGAMDEAGTLRRALGERVVYRLPDKGDTVSAVVVGVDPLRLRFADGRIAFTPPGLPLYPPGTVVLRPSAQLALRSARPERQLRLGYFTSGARWTASYQVTLRRSRAQVGGTAVLDSEQLTADSAEVQLLAGAVNRVTSFERGKERLGARNIQLQEAVVTGAAAASDAASEQRAGEFHLYTLPGRYSLVPGTTTLAPLFEPAEAPYEKTYLISGALPWYGPLAQRGDAQDQVPVQVHYTLNRKRDSDFGERPLPEGVARIFERDSAGRLQMIGEAQVGHTPAGNDLRLVAGNAFDVTATRIEKDFAVAHDTLRLPDDKLTYPQVHLVTYEVTIRNATDTAATVDVEERRYHPWIIVSSSVKPPEALGDYDPLPGAGTASRPDGGPLPGQSPVVTDATIVHCSDLHFGRHADLPQVEALERFVATLETDAIVVSGDLTQRARHGEFQRARAFVRHLQEHAPTLVVPGNHDIEWWKSPLGLRGSAVKYAKYRRYLGALRPVLELPGAIIAGALSSYGVALGSLTWNVNDMAVKGHLPRAETRRVKQIFAGARPSVARVLVIHHNVLAGSISRRMGLARWRSAHRLLLDTGADVVLCGHDHQEGAGQVEGRLTVSTSGTHSFRSRGGRPSVFNVVRIEQDIVHVQHYRWDAGPGSFAPSDRFSFARHVTPEPVVSTVDGVEV